MWKKTIIILFYIFTCINIYSTYKYVPKENQSVNSTSQHENNNNIQDNVQINKIIEELPIGKLVIKKINLEKNLYTITSNKNNIEKNVTILKNSEDPSIENTAFFLAAHSGTGSLAYFQELDKLELNDLIILEYKNKTYKYKVKNIWIDKKNGSITVPKENTNQLILTTCHPQKNNYQLIINCIKIE